MLTPVSVGGSLLPPLRDPTPPARHDRDMFKFVVTVTPCFTMGKSQGWGTLPKSQARLANGLVLGLLIWECPHCMALPYIFHLLERASCVTTHCDNHHMFVDLMFSPHTSLIDKNIKQKAVHHHPLQLCKTLSSRKVWKDWMGLDVECSQ